MHSTNEPDLDFRVVCLRSIPPMAFRILHYAPASHVKLDQHGWILDSTLEIDREAEIDHCPLCDSTQFGYRCEPSIVVERHSIVNLIYRLFATGMAVAGICRSLAKQGIQFHGKTFEQRDVEMILSDPRYFGNSLKTYLERIDPSLKSEPVESSLSSNGDTQIAFEPTSPSAEPSQVIVPFELWQQVQDRLQSQGNRLNQPQKATSNTGCVPTPAEQQFAKPYAYRQLSIRKRLDVAIDQLLQQVERRIATFETVAVKPMQEPKYATDCDLTRVLETILAEIRVAESDGTLDPALFAPSADPNTPILQMIFEGYNRMHAQRTIKLREELASIEQIQVQITNLLNDPLPARKLKKKLFNRSMELEARMEQIKPLLVPLTERAEVLLRDIYPNLSPLSGLPTNHFGIPQVIECVDPVRTARRQPRTAIRPDLIAEPLIAARTQPTTTKEALPEAESLSDNLAVLDAAAFLGISTSLLYSLVAGERIPHVRIGNGRGKILFSREDLIRWREQQKKGSAPTPAPKANRVVLKHIQTK